MAGLVEPTGRSARIDRRRCRDEPLVVEERSTERRLEEVVLDRVARMAGAVEVLVDRQRLGVVGAHRQAHRVAARDVAILLAAIDLVLLVIEAVDDVTRAATG